ncbi:efflux RND transporter periplasmic adaptor subunit [Granulicella sp. S156]|jgi:RND family efflux transporter MFP subunit|uniref:efflux RND transporter periplasmic adaptor subunit n=1 Tax=Granulicella sp. S156 TaxID=1747224 RepID=UPI00131C02AE|nr:efflux RND transporter periplasmic adaptor subunit [Granulicella sp. S156]
MKRLTFRSTVPVQLLLASSFAIGLAGCKQAPPAQAAGGPQAMPVQVSTISLSSVPASDTYVSTIKSRRSATMQPQVDGNITRILVKSGDHVKAGQLLITIDPLKQQATVAQQRGTELQKKAVVDYNRIEENRQKQLFEAGVISRDAYDQAVQSLGNSAGDYDAAVQGRQTQQEQLAYYQIRAPFAGIIGDVPVHQGDYVSPTTVLTTVDENSGLEAYIYIPTERATQVKLGLPVDLQDTAGNTITKSTISFLSPQVDNGTQTILAKAEVPSGTGALLVRNQQLINARVTWSSNPTPVVPVLAITRVGGQTFVFVAASGGNGYTAHMVAVTLGDTLGNTYPVLTGLHAGDKVILSGLQFLQEGMPVKPLS